MRAALPAALALVLAAVSPAAASGLPPLGLDQGHGSVGLGMFHVAGDVAVLDDVTIGADAYFMLMWNAASARASWTGWQGPGGAFGLLAAGGNGLTYSSEAVPFLQVGPIYESPPWPVRVRAALTTGVWTYTRREYASGASYGATFNPMAMMNGDALVATRTSYELGFQPIVEIVVPLGANFELTLLGNSLAGLYGRW